MKTNYVISMFTILLWISPLMVNAQQQPVKLAHINSNKLLEMMPEKAKAQKQVEDFAKELENQLKTMSGEYETKVQDYQNKMSLMTEPIKQTKQKEIMDLETRIRDFQQNAQASLQKKETEALEPIVNKAKKAIEEVAKEKGYHYVFDSSIGVLLYAHDSDDILQFVKKKMGLL